MASNVVAIIGMFVVWRFHKRQLAQEAAADEQGAESAMPIEDVDDDKIKEEVGATAVTIPVKELR